MLIVQIALGIILAVLLLVFWRGIFITIWALVPVALTLLLGTVAVIVATSDQPSAPAALFFLALAIGSGIWCVSNLREDQ